MPVVHALLDKKPTIGNPLAVLHGFDTIPDETAFQQVILWFCQEISSSLNLQTR